MPLGSEDPLSLLGQQRYYNNADIIVVVSNSSVSVTSGRWNSFATSLNTNEVSRFVSTNASFYNKRENKTVQAIQIDVAGLKSWNATNASIRPYLPQHDVDTIYVSDRRTLSGANESGVRLVNGTDLPPQGLTLATESPAYILGDYNVPAAAKGTTNTVRHLARFRGRRRDHHPLDRLEGQRTAQPRLPAEWPAARRSMRLFLRAMSPPPRRTTAAVWRISRAFWKRGVARRLRTMGQ